MPIFVTPTVAITLWSNWFPDLAPQLKDCPNILMAHELRRAAQAFFKKTRAWKVVQPLVAVTAGDPDVDVALSDSMQELVQIEKAWLDGQLLTPKTTAEMDAEFSDDWRLHTGTPTVFVQITPGALTLYPIPLANSVTGLKLLVSVRPSETATGLPDDLAIRFRDEIHTGAKARLMMQPDKSWSNPDLAGVAAAAFDKQVSSGNRAAAMGFGRGRIAARPTWC